MARVLINLLSVNTGGGLTYARALIPLLLRHLGDALVLHGEALADLPLEEGRRVRVKGLWTRGAARLVWERLHLPVMLRRLKADVLYTPYQVAVQPASVRSVCALRNLEPFFAARYPYTRKSAMRNTALLSLTRTSLARADRVIAVSRYARTVALETLGLPDAKVVTVYHGRDESLAGPDTAEDQAVRTALGVGGPYVLTAGSLLPYRRIEDVIAAFELTIACLSSETALLIAGTGTDRRYAKTVRTLLERSPCRSKIRLLGQRDRREMRALYKGCRLFVSASEVEACPNIGIEAMTAGRAILAANSGPASEIYGDGAALYQPRDVTELAALMASVWSDEALAAEMGRRAVQRSVVFSWDACAAAMARALSFD